MLCAEAEKHHAAGAYANLNHGGSVGDYLLTVEPAAQEEIFGAIARNGLHVVENAPG